MSFFLLGAPEREAKKEKDKRSKKVKEHVNSLISNSTLHGLHYCFEKKHPLRRIFWTVLLLIALGLLVQKLYESTKQFFDYPFSTTTTIKYVNNMNFPAISFCNLNDMRLSVMNGTRLDDAIKKRMHPSQAGISGDEYTSTLRNANHRIQDMLVSCKFGNKPCSVDEFNEFKHKQGDRCFTFNSGKGQNKNNGKILTINNTGVGHALELVINVEHHDYYRDSEKAGIHLIVHAQDETPVKTQGVILSPGFVTYAEIRKRRVS